MVSYGAKICFRYNNIYVYERNNKNNLDITPSALSFDLLVFESNYHRDSKTKFNGSTA